MFETNEISGGEGRRVTPTIVNGTFTPATLFDLPHHHRPSAAT
jgi:hypothetical protein